MKHEITVFAYNIDIFILLFLNKIATIFVFRLFFDIDIPKKSLYHQDSSLRVMCSSYEIEENYR